MCSFDSTSSCVDVADICELVAEGTLFRDETDCSRYYKCTKGKHVLTSCKSSMYFSKEANGCVERAKVACTAHPYYSNICLNSKKNPSPGKKTDKASCRGYFHCLDFGIGKNFAYFKKNGKIWSYRGKIKTSFTF